MRKSKKKENLKRIIIYFECLELIKYKRDLVTSEV